MYMVGSLHVTLVNLCNITDLFLEGISFRFWIGGSLFIHTSSPKTLYIPGYSINGQHKIYHMPASASWSTLITFHTVYSSVFMLHHTVYVRSKSITFVIMRPYIWNTINTTGLLDVSCCPLALLHKNTSIRLYKNNACYVICTVEALK